VGIGGALRDVISKVMLCVIARSTTADMNYHRHGQKRLLGDIRKRQHPDISRYIMIYPDAVHFIEKYKEDMPMC
jgi:hypothetical protein